MGTAETISKGMKRKGSKKVKSHEGHQQQASDQGDRNSTALTGEITAGSPKKKLKKRKSASTGGEVADKKLFADDVAMKLSRKEEEDGEAKVNKTKPQNKKQKKSKSGGKVNTEGQSEQQNPEEISGVGKTEKNESPRKEPKPNKRRHDSSAEDQQTERDASKESTLVEKGEGASAVKAEGKKRKTTLAGEEKGKETVTPVEKNSTAKKQNGATKPEVKREGKKKKKKKQEVEVVRVAAGGGNNKILGIGYLRSWEKSKGPKGGQWRFQKIRQVWLLHHMLESDQVSTDDFAILLEYLKGLQGRSRELTVQKMEALIQELDEKMQQASEEEDGGDSSKEMKTKWKRASSVLQTLT